MKYLIQILVMIGDILLLSACSYILISSKFNILAIIISLLTIIMWIKQGGFVAWKPKMIKKFFRNAKRIGL